MTVPAGDLAPLGNPDGELDAADFLILQRFILGTLTPTPEQRLIADVAPLGSPDGELNAGDLVVLMRAIHGLVSLPPVYLGPDAPVLNAASGATHANPYTLTGTAQAGSEVRLYLNGALHETTTASGPHGSFEFQIILRDGENQLYAVVVEAGEEGPASDLLTLDYVNDIPREQGGTLTGNVVWTPGVAPTPYVITSTLDVAPGASLTLMPGTVLRFATGAALDVAGMLNVAGDSVSPVLFTSDAATPAPGDWAGLNIRASSQDVRLDDAIIEYAASGITVDGAQTHISNCTVRGYSKTSGRYGVGFINGAGGIVEDCIIDNALAGPNSHYSSGIYVATGAQPELRRNSISETGSGVFVGTGAPWLHGNTIENNSRGIQLLGTAQALINGLNVIRDNSQTGIQYDGGFGWDIPGSIVKNNAIYNNRFNVYASGFRSSDEFEIDLTENWWGTTSPSVISSGIWDHKDAWGENTPPVRVAPFLESPGGQPVSGNFLNGRVTQDTTLGSGIGPYTILGSYVVSPDMTLTIPPGSHIHLASNTVLHARGNLVIQGAVDEQVIFDSLDDVSGLPPGWGALIGDLTWKGVISESTITGARFEGLYYATEIGSANAAISNSHYSNNHRSIVFNRYSNGEARENVVEGIKSHASGGTAGVLVMSDGEVSVTKNTISGMVTGVSVAQYGRPGIRENTITGTTYGIHLSAHNPSDEIVPVINGGNTITGNDYGILSWRVLRGSVTVNHNNIYGNSINYDKSDSSLVEDATNNWWNTTVEAEIAAGINAQTAGTVTYTPFLSGPVPVAPVLDQSILLTNESSYVISGNAQPGTQVRVYINSVERLIVDTAQNGTFSGAVTLTEGENSIHAEAFNATTTSSPSNTILVTLDTAPPVIDLTAPASGGVINAYPLFTGTLSEPSTLTVAGQSVVVATDNSFRHGPVSLNEGSNNVAVIATDLAGNITTQNVTLTLDTTPPADPDMGLVTFSPLADGTVRVTGAAGAIEAGAFVYVANARTGQITVVSADGNGAFTASIAAQPGDTLSLVATDGLGNQTAWAQEVVAGTPPEFAILETDPPNGAVIPNDSVTISGSFQGGENIGIVIAGQAAQIEGNHFMVSDVSLIEGMNDIEIVATTLDGGVHTHVLSLSSTGSIPFSVRVSPETGTSPLIATLTLYNDTGLPIQLLQYDLDNDGSYELSYPDLNYSEVWIGLVYHAGLHKGRVRVVDANGSSYVLPFGAVVEEAIGKQARLRAVYRHMIDRLDIGDIPGALRYIDAQNREEYSQIFSALSEDLSEYAGQLRDVQGVLFGDDVAEFSVTLSEDSVEQAYLIYLMWGSDGVWRISDM